MYHCKKTLSSSFLLRGSTKCGLIVCALAAGAYLLLDIYTKIIFNVQLKK